MYIQLYIQEETFFSFEEILKFQPQTKLQIILSQLDCENLVSNLEKDPTKRGPKGYSPRNILYSLIAMVVEKMSYLKTLVDKLQEDPVLRVTCGFPVLSETPSLATFSRFLNKLEKTDNLKNELHQLVIKAKELNIIDGKCVAIDSTDINAYEKSIPESKVNKSPNTPDWGSKTGVDGKKKRWFGYKVHLLVDCKCSLPLEVSVTPASWNDGNKEIVYPLIDNCLKDYNDKINPKFWMMDTGYDNVNIYEHVRDIAKGFAIIPYNPRSEKAPPAGFNNKYQPICSMGYPLTFWGIDGNYLKYRCPLVTKEVNCPLGSNWCSNSNYGFCKKFNCNKEPRLYTYPPRNTEKWHKLYNLRDSIERCNNTLKNHLNLKTIRSKGTKKATVFALLNCIALIAGVIGVNKVKHLNKVA